jgi:decaprenylphospho-beta-D-erythro-pentofuranosid-2-ulose 2-reductase
MSDTILVLGAGSAMARAIAHELAATGHSLILAGRGTDDLEKTAADLRVRHEASVTVRRFEATDFDDHERFFGDCVKAAGGELHGVILCHGYMAEQAVAQRDFAEARRMIDVNYASAVSVLEQAARYLEDRKRGYVCAITSVAGDRGRRSNYLYGSSKAALNTYLQGLRHRLSKSGVPVLTVKPGFVDTRMTWGLPGLFLVASPDKVAKDVCKAIRKKRNVTYTPWFWRGIMSIICAVPDFIFRRTKL